MQLINSGSKVNVNIEDLTVEKLRQVVHNSASDFSLQHVGEDHKSAAIISKMMAEEGSSDEWGGLSAITILAKQHRVRVSGDLHMFHSIDTVADVDNKTTYVPDGVPEQTPVIRISRE